MGVVLNFAQFALSQPSVNQWLSSPKPLPFCSHLERFGFFLLQFASICPHPPLEPKPGPLLEILDRPETPTRRPFIYLSLLMRIVVASCNHLTNLVSYP